MQNPSHPRANTRTGGWDGELYVQHEVSFICESWGVDDATHKIVVTEFQYRKMKKGNKELEAWLSRMLSPRINFRFFEVPMDEGMVVLMEIPCSEKQPVQFAGGEYIRIGTNKKNLKISR